VSAQPKENVEKTHVTVMQDRRITTRLLAESLGVSMEVARKTVERDLERRKIGSRFVPRCGGTERVAG
jgi:ribosomal protein S25